MAFVFIWLSGFVSGAFITAAWITESAKTSSMVKKHVMEMLIGRPAVSGRSLRTELRRFVRLSGPRFYQIMRNLEECGLVEGWYEREVIDGTEIKQRHYKLKP